MPRQNSYEELLCLFSLMGEVFSGVCTLYYRCVVAAGYTDSSKKHPSAGRREEASKLKRAASSSGFARFGSLFTSSFSRSRSRHLKDAPTANFHSGDEAPHAASRDVEYIRYSVRTL